MQMEATDPLCQGTDDATLERFLVINSMDVRKTSNFFFKYHQCWQSFTPLGYIPEEEVANEG